MTVANSKRSRGSPGERSAAARRRLLLASRDNPQHLAQKGPNAHNDLLGTTAYAILKTKR